MAALAYTASSADAERAFSFTGRVMTKRRAKMSLDLLRDTTLIGGNKELIVRMIEDTMRRTYKLRTAAELIKLTKMQPTTDEVERQSAREIIEDSMREEREKIVQNRQVATRERADRKRQRDAATQSARDQAAMRNAAAEAGRKKARSAVESLFNR